VPGLPADPEPAPGGAAVDPLPIGTPFPVEFQDATVAVTVHAVESSTEPLPGTDQGPTLGDFVVVDMTWEVVDGSLPGVDGYDMVELTNEAGDWIFAELGHDGFLSADALATGDSVDGVVAFDVDPAAGPFVLEIYDEGYELAYRGEITAP